MNPRRDGRPPQGGVIVPPFSPPGGSPNLQLIQSLLTQVNDLTTALHNTLQWIQAIAQRVPVEPLSSSLWGIMPVLPAAPPVGSSLPSGPSGGRPNRVSRSFIVGLVRTLTETEGFGD